MYKNIQHGYLLILVIICWTQHRVSLVQEFDEKNPYRKFGRNRVKMTNLVCPYVQTDRWQPFLQLIQPVFIVSDQ